MKARRKIGKLRSGFYDPTAPKFTYVRDVFSNTRKSSRVSKFDDLQIGKISEPPAIKQKGSLYPWTKPMFGWKRVYAGEGRWISKGRQSRRKQGVQPKSVPSKKTKWNFIKYPKTYRWRGDTKDDS